MRCVPKNMARAASFMVYVQQIKVCAPSFMRCALPTMVHVA